MSVFASNWILVVVAGFLVMAVIGFIAKFVVPAFRIGRDLDSAIAKLRRIKQEDDAHLTSLERITDEVMLGVTLTHCWSEFRETLHGQTGVNNQGQEVVVRYRATAMAATFFTPQALVETPLASEFFKHLPGILTGLGIIGTFTGLINGSIDFQVTNNADQVRQVWPV